jgi:hypothetical protein
MMADTSNTIANLIDFISQFFLQCALRNKFMLDARSAMRIDSSDFRAKFAIVQKYTRVAVNAAALTCDLIQTHTRI